jgi:hypothetical protein
VGTSSGHELSVLRGAAITEDPAFVAAHVFCRARSARFDAPDAASRRQSGAYASFPAETSSGRTSWPIWVVPRSPLLRLTSPAGLARRVSTPPTRPRGDCQVPTQASPWRRAQGARAGPSGWCRGLRLTSSAGLARRVSAPPTRPRSDSQVPTQASPQRRAQGTLSPVYLRQRSARDPPFAGPTCRAVPRVPRARCSFLRRGTYFQLLVLGVDVSMNHVLVVNGVRHARPAAGCGCGCACKCIVHGVRMRGQQLVVALRKRVHYKRCGCRCIVHGVRHA